MITHIQITDDISIPYGNMHFIYNCSGYSKLHSKCVELEQSLKSDYKSFALNYRMILEELVLAEETKRRIIQSGMRFNEQTTREKITWEVTHSKQGYPDILVQLCIASANSDKLEAFIKKQTSTKVTWDTETYHDELTKFIRSIFRFASQNLHSGEKTSGIVLDNDSCRDYFRKLFLFLCAYFGHDAKYDGALIPFRDYYPVPRSVREQCGIILDKKKQLYVRLHDGQPRFYLFVSITVNISDTEKRDTETIHKLWMDNLDSPQNVINNPTYVANKNGIDHKFWIYPLPSFPQSLTDSYINSLSQEERILIVRGIVRGIASMHNAEPPYYHRVISPSAFLICRIKDKLKPLLINFDCVKDTDEDAEFTVLYAVYDAISDTEQPESTFAPELLTDEEIDGDAIDWSKVDIYALGKTISKVLFNTYELPNASSEMPEEQLQMLQTICSEDAINRPDINEIIHLF